MKLIIPFIQWEIKPRVDMWQISLINTLGNGFNLFGALILGLSSPSRRPPVARWRMGASWAGWALDRWGFRLCSVAATVSQGVLFLLCSSAEMLPVWLAMQVLRLGDHFKQICEAQVSRPLLEDARVRAERS